MTYEEAIEKIRKLQALATSDNPHEAAQAAARAQEIMTRYSIEAAAIVDADPEAARNHNEAIEDFRGEASLDGNAGGTNFPRWRAALGNVLSDVNGTKVYLGNGTLAIIGKRSAVQTVRYMYAWLTREVERLTAVNCAGRGRTYANNFRIGCVNAIAEKVHTAKAVAEAAVRSEVTGAALIRIDKALVRTAQDAKAVSAWADVHLNLRTVGASKVRGNADAYAAGKRAGESINIGARPSLGAGQRAIR